MTPLVGRKVWFAPRRWGGWGWQPVTVLGWAVVVAYTAAVLVPMSWAEDSPWGYLAWVGVCTAALLGVSYVKGTSPGSESAWRAYQASRADRS